MSKITDAIRSACVASYTQGKLEFEAAVDTFLGTLPPDVFRGGGAWLAAVNGSQAEVWNAGQLLGTLRTHALNLVNRMMEAVRVIVKERPDDAAQLHGWPPMLNELAFRGFDELQEALQKRLGLSLTSTGLTDKRQQELNLLQQELASIRNDLGTIAITTGNTIEEELEREQAHDLLIPFPDERSVGGKRYARTVQLPREPWEGIRHPRTGKIDVSMSVDTKRDWITVGYPELGEIQVSIKPGNYQDTYIERIRRRLHDLYDHTGIMVRDGVNADWVLGEWTKCHVFGTYGGTRFLEVASQHPEHLVVKEHLQWSRDYETQRRDITTQASRESDLAYNAAVSTLRTQWLGMPKKDNAVAAWDLMRRTMQDVAKAAARAYGRITSDILKLKHPPEELVFIDTKQNGKRVVRLEKALGRKSWLNVADCKLVGLLAAFDSSDQFKSRKLISALDLVAGLGSAMARNEHDSAGLDEMPGWTQASDQDKEHIAAEFGREVDRSRAICESLLRAAIDEALTATKSTVKGRHPKYQPQEVQDQCEPKAESPAASPEAGKPSVGVGIKDVGVKLQWLFTRKEASGGDCSGFKEFTHPQLCEALRRWLKRHERFFGELVSVATLQSPRDKGVDVMMTLSSGAQYGCQVKSYREFSEENVSAALKTQVFDSGAYRDLKRLFILPFADPRTPKHDRKLGILKTDLQQANLHLRNFLVEPECLLQVIQADEDVAALERAWETHWSAQAPSARPVVIARPVQDTVSWEKVLNDLRSRFHDRRSEARRVLEFVITTRQAIPPEATEELFHISMNTARGHPAEERGAAVNLLYRAEYFIHNQQLLDLYLAQQDVLPRELSMWIGNYFGYYANIEGLRMLMGALIVNANNPPRVRTREEAFIAIRQQINFPILINDEDREQMLAIVDVYKQYPEGRDILSDIAKTLTGVSLPPL